MTDEIKKILKIVQIVIAALLIIFFAILVVLGIIVRVNEEKAARLPFTVLEITSDSMYPKIKKGDGIIEVKADYEKLKVGNIITFFNDGEFVTHRIVGIDGNKVTTKGDANPYSDAPITQNRYVGKVIMVLPGLSAFIYMTEGWKKVIWIVVIIFVLFAPEIIVKTIEMKHATKKKECKTENHDPQSELQKNDLKRASSKEGYRRMPGRRR